MELGLKDKVALVTGSSKGLGAAAAAALASEGARLFLTARDDERLRQSAERVAEAGAAEVDTLAADLTEADAADRIADAVRQRFGRIDILINSAGASQGGVFWELPDRVWEESLALKLMGTVRMIRAVIPTMREQKCGRIVTIVGNNGRQPPPRMLPGAAANAALLAVTTGLAQEVAADGVVVLAVNPGPTRTERWRTLMQNLAAQRGTSIDEEEAAFLRQIPMGRLGAPEEVGRIVAFLASDAAANMTGTSVTADGGWTKALA